MNIRQSVLGSIAVRSGQNVTGIDTGTLVRRLILFDKTVVMSSNLYEVPFLVRTFHKEGFTELINSGLLRFACGGTFLVVDVARDGVRELPLNHFSFGIASAANQGHFLKLGLAGLQGIPGLKSAERAAVEDLALGAVVPLPASYGQDLLNQLDSDIRTNNPSLKLAIIERLKSESRIQDLPLSNFGAG